MDSLTGTYESLSYRYHTADQLLFAMTFFRDLPRVNWFGATNFCDQILSTPGFFITTNWQILARNIHNDEALMNLAKFLLHMNGSWFTVHKKKCAT